MLSRYKHPDGLTRLEPLGRTGSAALYLPSVVKSVFRGCPVKVFSGRVAAVV